MEEILGKALEIAKELNDKREEELREIGLIVENNIEEGGERRYLYLEGEKLEELEKILKRY